MLSLKNLARKGLTHTHTLLTLCLVLLHVSSLFPERVIHNKQHEDKVHEQIEPPRHRVAQEIDAVLRTRELLALGGK